METLFGIAIVCVIILILCCWMFPLQHFTLFPPAQKSCYITGINALDVKFVPVFITKPKLKYIIEYTTLKGYFKTTHIRRGSHPNWLKNVQLDTWHEILVDFSTRKILAINHGAFLKKHAFLCNLLPNPIADIVINYVLPNKIPESSKRVN
jgi:hypothetical protein